MFRRILAISILLLLLCAGCGVYSLSGASIEGKTIRIGAMENRARNIVPSLSPTLTTKIRNRILSQTGLAPVTADDADYDLTGVITSYETVISGVQNTQQASQNRLSISLQIVFKNRKNQKAGFTQSFSRFADYPATQTLQNVEARLIDDIGNQLADDIFNRAFVNW